ncbi:MAG: hypothetical protein DWQ07_17215 [Chloroflexi bacterium]|nr:MAG: hypothetical protein DWQ07_17215 [Chloroflexota bacterium]MBL1195146.1 hypothetical protein [Chloroflexota bacterium]NOH12431.1 hypothetical protein [Chloroflexota bacterium]
MKNNRIIFLLLALAFAIPQTTFAAPSKQRCVPSAALVSGNASYELSPGEVVRHSWLIENNGDCPWPHGVQLHFVDDSRFSGPRGYALSSLYPGESAELSFDLQAPEQAGEYAGLWRLSAKDGYFGPRLQVQIIVSAPAIDGFDNPGRHEPPLPEEDPPLTVGPQPFDPGSPDGFLPPYTKPELFTVSLHGVIDTQLGSAFVDCPVGSLVTGGGWYFDFLADDTTRVYESRPAGTTGWQVRFSKDTSEPVLVGVYARCLSNPQGVITIHTADLTLDHHGEAHVVACPIDMEAIGGGFSYPASEELSLYRLRPFGEYFRIVAGNFGDTPIAMTGYAICNGDGTHFSGAFVDSLPEGPNVTSAHASTTLHPNQNAGLWSPSCSVSPDGVEQATSPGFNTSADVYPYESNMVISELFIGNNKTYVQAWNLNTYNSEDGSTTGATRSITAYVTCAIPKD